MTQLEQYQKAYATLVGMVDTVITELENFPAKTMPPALTAGKLKHALETAEEFFLAEEPEEA